MQWHTYDNDQTVADALADAVAADLRTALDARGTALLALSGGTTPKRFMQALSQRELDWSAVTVTLVDERWVPPEHPRSNARLLRDNLLHGRAGAARFVPLYADAPTPESGLPGVAARIGALDLPPDVVVLGMGTDGHTASFFPDGDHLAEALDLDGRADVLPMRAADAGEPRITLTLALLVKAHAMYLHIEGLKKRHVLELATHDTDLPIAAVLAAVTHLQTYWCA